MFQRVGFSGLGIAVAVLFWPAEALLHAFIFGDESFFDNLFSGDEIGRASCRERV